MNAIIETSGELYIEAENTEGYALLSWFKKLPHHLNAEVDVTNNLVTLAIPEFKDSNTTPFEMSEISLIREALAELDIKNTYDSKYRESILSKLKELTK